MSGYGIMSVLYYKVMVQYFPKGDVSSACFLPWIDRYPELILVGLGMSFGLFGHLAIMWGSRVNEHIQGLFYAAPVYDIPAIAAFLSILVTTINFVTSVEVNFYPKYRNFFDALNNGGILKDINRAGQEMKEVLFRELTYTFMKQLFTTIVFIIGGSIILPMLPLGMTDDMLGIFRVLCVGYAFYAVGSCLMLIQLYFADNKGALISVLAFMFTSCGGSLIVRELDIKFYGVDIYVVVTGDYHISEYAGDYFKEREFITGFTGSAGTAVITQDDARLFTDGRYFVQAEKQIEGTGFSLMRVGAPGVMNVAQYCESIVKDGMSMGFDGRTMPAEEGIELSDICKKAGAGCLYDFDAIENIYEDRAAFPHSKAFYLDEEYSGESIISKLSRIRKYMDNKNADIHIMATLDDICWTFNIRGCDVE